MPMIFATLGEFTDDQTHHYSTLPSCDLLLIRGEVKENARCFLHNPKISHQHHSFWSLIEGCLEALQFGLLAILQGLFSQFAWEACSCTFACMLLTSERTEPSYPFSEITEVSRGGLHFVKLN